MKHFSGTTFHRVTRWLSPVLAVLLVLPNTAAAQTPSATVQSYRIIPLAGNGEMNDLQRKVMAPIVVQVLDQNSRPVEGASVTFRFPVSGPGAAFPDGKTSQTVSTNADGQAALVGWAANNMVGRFEVQVTATRGNEFGSGVISMSNVTSITEATRKEHKGWWSKKRNKIIVIGAAAAVAATVAILLTRGSSSTTLTAVPGFPTIGGAQ